jgi:hypothetical protein
MDEHWQGCSLRWIALNARLTLATQARSAMQSAERFGAPRAGVISAVRPFADSIYWPAYQTLSAGPIPSHRRTLDSILAPPIGYRSKNQERNLLEPAAELNVVAKTDGRPVLEFNLAGCVDPTGPAWPDDHRELVAVGEADAVASQRNRSSHRRCQLPIPSGAICNGPLEYSTGSEVVVVKT